MFDFAECRRGLCAARADRQAFALAITLPLSSFVRARAAWPDDRLMVLLLQMSTRTRAPQDVAVVVKASSPCIYSIRNIQGKPIDPYFWLNRTVFAPPNTCVLKIKASGLPLFKAARHELETSHLDALPPPMPQIPPADGDQERNEGPADDSSSGRPEKRRRQS